MMTRQLWRTYKLPTRLPVHRLLEFFNDGKKLFRVLVPVRNFRLARSSMRQRLVRSLTAHGTARATANGRSPTVYKTQ